MSPDSASPRDELLALLRCPRTGEPLRRVPADELETLNAAIRAGEVRTSDGELISSPWVGAVAARESSIYYPVVAGVLALAPDEGASIVRDPTTAPRASRPPGSGHS